MRIFTRLFAIALLAGLLTPVSAQSQTADRMIVVTFTDQDGAKTIIKKRIDKDTDWKEELQQIRNEEGSPQDMEIRVVDADVEAANPETVVFIRHAKEEGEAAAPRTTRMVWVQEKDGEMKEHKEHQFHYNVDHQYKHVEHNADGQRPLLGIYPANLSGGLTVEGLVDGGGAEAAGLSSGDVITAINGVSISDADQLRTELNKNKVGDQVGVSYLRNGQPAQAMVTLGASSDQGRRDPCHVFIGVNVGGRAASGGVHVNSVIDETSADEYGVADGDIILALDDVLVNSFGELLRERNKHKPGDWYTLSVLRNGQPVEVDARFKVCEEENLDTVVPEEAEDIVEVEREPLPLPVEIVEKPSLPALDNSLPTQSWRVYPNPTFGMLRLQFQAEAVPTQINIVDINGKVVYERNLQNFDGYFDKEISLANATPGAYFLKVIQGDKVRAEKLILMPRA